MRRILLVSILLLAGALQTGCMYADLRLPLDTDVDETRLGAKIGRSDAYSVMWLFSWGDCGTASAADNGGIQIIRHLDDEYKIILWGLFIRRTTIAYGD